MCLAGRELVERVALPRKTAGGSDFDAKGDVKRMRENRLRF
jgi:hypothetical protein